MYKIALIYGIDVSENPIKCEYLVIDNRMICLEETMGDANSTRNIVDLASFASCALNVYFC